MTTGLHCGKINSINKLSNSRGSAIASKCVVLVRLPLNGTICAVLVNYYHFLQTSFRYFLNLLPRIPYSMLKYLVLPLLTGYSDNKNGNYL